MQLVKRLILREILDENPIEMGIRKLDPASVLVRDQVYVPPGWDSWNKLAVLREGFDTASISNMWTNDLDRDANADGNDRNAKESIIALFEELILDPAEKNALPDKNPEELEVVAIDRLKLLQELEQRQWEIQEDVDNEMTEVHDSTADQREAPRQRPKQGTGVRDVRPGSLTRVDTSKDEYIQTFFQNLLDRSSQRGST